jgi:hypothetical protein
LPRSRRSRPSTRNWGCGDRGRVPRCQRLLFRDDTQRALVPGRRQPVRARWSAAVQDEWIAALLRHRPDIDPQRIARTRTLKDARIPDAVVSGYEALTI